MILPSLLLQGKQTSCSSTQPVLFGGTVAAAGSPQHQNYLCFARFRSFSHCCAPRLRLARLIAPEPTDASSARTPSPPKSHRSCGERQQCSATPRRSVLLRSPNSEIWRKKLFKHFQKKKKPPNPMDVWQPWDLRTPSL